MTQRNTPPSDDLSPAPAAPFELPRADPLGLGPALQAVARAAASNPAGLTAVWARAMADAARLGLRAASGQLGRGGEPVIDGPPRDPRFRDDAWRDQPFFDGLRQAFLLLERSADEALGEATPADPAMAHRARFALRQLLEALSPANNPWLNPAVLRATRDESGANLLRGLRHLLADIRDGGGTPRLAFVDPSRFRLGPATADAPADAIHLAATPGAVVAQTELMQLLQYAPTTPTVRRTPILVVPPWINRYYILDLQPHNSFVRWLTDQGHTVFCISWRNPGAELAHKRLDDYVTEGVIAAAEAIEAATGEARCGAIGYCLGGTLLSAAAAVLARRRRRADRQRLAWMALFTTMTDFCDPGEVQVFCDAEQIDELERRMLQRGYLTSDEMAFAFAAIRPREMVWLAMVNRYLLGLPPAAFDMLYWNSDGTRLPAAMHIAYLRGMYLENRFKDPGGLELCGVPIDLGAVGAPAYLVACEEDHIAPWRTCYRTAGLLGGADRFVLSGSGHVAGIINPPAKGRHGFRTHAALPPDADDWYEGSTAQPGSFWPDLADWIAARDDGDVPSRSPGDGALPALEPAPGSYLLSGRGCSSAPTGESIR